jgi:D-glycero-D-manno-heptose 1,7-bisphosphate phosphatase
VFFAFFGAFFINGQLPATFRFVKNAIFIERDGVLNRALEDHGHPVPPLSVGEFALLPHTCPFLRRLKAAGFLLLVTTNQPGISRGYLCRSELDLMHRQIKATLPVDDILVCPHDEMDRCPCRKPKPGLLAEAAFRWSLDLDHSFVISDKWQDAEAARNAGCTSVLLRSPWNGPVHHDFIVGDFPAAVDKILQLRPGQTVFSARLLCS